MISLCVVINLSLGWLVSVDYGDDDDGWDGLIEMSRCLVDLEWMQLRIYKFLKVWNRKS